jgi:hypothetical protein
MLLSVLILVDSGALVALKFAIIERLHNKSINLFAEIEVDPAVRASVIPGFPLLNTT